MTIILSNKWVLVVWSCISGGQRRILYSSPGEGRAVAAGIMGICSCMGVHHWAFPSCWWISKQTLIIKYFLLLCTICLYMKTSMSIYSSLHIKKVYYDQKIKHLVPCNNMNFTRTNSHMRYQHVWLKSERLRSILSCFQVRLADGFWAFTANDSMQDLLKPLSFQR